MDVLLFFGAIIAVVLFIKSLVKSSPNIESQSDSWQASYTHYKKIYADIDPDTVWVAPGDNVSIMGNEIPGGMLYVGKHLQPAGGYCDVEPSLIIPKLKVNFNNPDIDGSQMDYWPSYSDITPSSRAAYINWLFSGRADPKYSIGYVFLFFYGLERRVFADTNKSEQAKNDIPAIKIEVERLMNIYGYNDSFHRYATRFLEGVDILLNPHECYNNPPPAERTSWELPISLRMSIGQLMAEGKPIPVEWAYSWVMLHPDTRLRTPADRCQGEFRTLFIRRYEDKYGEGMILKSNKSRLKADIYTASRCVETVTISSSDIPDIARLTAPVNKLRKVIEDCTDALDPLSRYLGRNPGQENSLEAYGLLPLELIETKTNPAAEKIKNWISDKLGDNRQASIDASTLVAMWSDSKTDGLSKKESTTLAQLLEKFGYGLVPDPRFGGVNLKAIGKAIIFSLEKNSPKVPTKEYQAATVLLRLAAIISGADGTVAESERDYLEAHVEKALKLSRGEKQRIKAHLDWLLSDPPGLAGMKKRIESLQENEKSSVAGFCLGVAGADGHIDPSEIKTLNKIYPMLGYNENDVFTHIHSMMSGGHISDSPVTIQKADDVQHGFKVPAEVNMEQMQRNGVDLDMNIVNAKLEETATVAQILGDIFDEDEPAESPPVIAQQQENTIGPLDIAHSLLLLEIVKQSKWSRSSFESLADQHGLLPDGALDMINDAAFEICDEPLLEGDDPIEVEMDIVKEYFS
jgi:tellurite resistance protein